MSAATQLALVAVVILSLLIAAVTAADVATAVVYAHQERSNVIAPNFIGFSIEWDIAMSWTGYQNAPRRSLTNLMKQLMLTPGQEGPVFRIGGNSADYSWFNDKAEPFPFPDIYYNITDADLISLHSVREFGGKLTLGLNFKWNNVSWAQRHLAAIDRIIGWTDGTIHAIELGNECEVYPRFHGNYSLFAQSYAEYSTDLRQTTPNLPQTIYQGAAFCCDSWLKDLPDYTSMFLEQLVSISVHHYPYCDCGNGGVTLEMMLTDASAEKEAKHLSTVADNVIARVNAYGLPFLIGEGNSVCCSGKRNVSDTYGITLWAIDELFNIASVNISNWAFHSHDRNISHYQPIIWQSNTDDTPTVNPLYYALRFFAEATSQYARIVTVNLKTTNNFTKIWCTIDQENTIKCAILHKDLLANPYIPATINIDLSNSLQDFPTARVERLVGRGPYDPYGVSFAGQTYDGSKDGRPIGHRIYERVTPTSAGIYTFHVTPMTSVLFTVRTRTTAATSGSIESE